MYKVRWSAGHTRRPPFPHDGILSTCYTSRVPGSNITMEELQAILKSMPVLIELHIQSCVKVSDPIDSSNQIRKSLSSYVPNLKVLVIDKINNILSSRQIIPFLQSNWLREGWPSAFRIRVEIILISLRHFFSSAAAFKRSWIMLTACVVRNMVIIRLRWCCDRKTRRIGNGQTRRLEICVIDGRSV